MNTLIAESSGLVGVWAELLWRGTWQGGIVILIVALLVTVLRPTPAWECWIIRMGWAKFALLLLCPFSLTLPLLPSSLFTDESRAVAGRPQVSQERSPERRSKSTIQSGIKYRDFQPKSSGRFGNLAPEPSSTPKLNKESKPTTLAQSQTVLRSPSSEPVVKKNPTQVTFMALLILFLLWLFGVGTCLVRLLNSGWKVRRIVQVARPIQRSELYAELRVLVQQVSRCRPPRLLTIPGRGSPQLMGLFRPAIVIPEDLIKQCSTAELRLVLGHELAHLERRDLWWNGLGAVIHALFFFHPGIWWISKRAHLSQELACDERVLNQERNCVAQYAKLLLKVLVIEKQTSHSSLGAVGIATGAKTLKERLEAMKTRTEQRRTWTTGGVLLASCVALLLPWQLVAKETTEQAEERQQEQRASERSEARSTSGSTSRSAMRSNSDTNRRPINQDGESRQERRSQRSSQARSEGARASSAEQTGNTFRSATQGSAAENRSNSRDRRVEVRSDSTDGVDTKSYVLVENGKTLKVNVSDGRIRVETREETEGRVSSKVETFQTLEDFQRKLPNEFKMFREMTQENRAESSRTTRETRGTRESRASRASEPTKAQQLLLEQLGQMRADAGDNKAMQAMIDNMIEDVKANKGTGASSSTSSSSSSGGGSSSSSGGGGTTSRSSRSGGTRR